MPVFRIAASLLCASLPVVAAARAEPVPVKHPSGEVHAFLVIRNDEGKLLGHADEVIARAGKAWSSRLTIRFLDGSLSDETTLYTQGATLHLLNDHLIQKGPSFPKPTDLTIDTAKGQVTWHELKDGRDEVKTDTMDLPPDLANGMMPLVVQNLARGTDEVKVGYIVTTPKPRLVKLAIHHEAQAGFRVAGAGRTAAHMRIHVEIGGVEGVVAPVIGKEPPDYDAWVSSGEAPTFLKLRGILYVGGPLWTLQLVSPQW